MWRSVKFRVVWGVLQWQTRQGEWIPVNSPLSGDYQRGTQRGSPGGATGTFGAPTGPDCRTPPLGLRPPGGGKPCTPDESAIVSWRPHTKAQYGLRLRALASYVTRTSPSTVAEALAGIPAERARMGATASSI